MFARKLFSSIIFRSSSLSVNNLMPSARSVRGVKSLSDDAKSGGKSGCNLPPKPSMPSKSANKSIPIVIPSDDKCIKTICESDSPPKPSKGASKSIPYPDEVEKQVNAQIQSELQASHTYLAMAQYFASEKYFVGFAAFYLQLSNAERGHALSLMGYQNLRGGFVVLDALKMPETPFKDIPTSLAFALDLETNLTNELTQLHEIGQQNNDLITMDLIASNYLKEHATSVQLIRNMIVQMKSATDDPIIRQLMNEQLRRDCAPNCIDDFMKLTGRTVNVPSRQPGRIRDIILDIIYEIINNFFMWISLSVE